MKLANLLSSLLQEDLTKELGGIDWVVKGFEADALAGADVRASTARTGFSGKLKDSKFYEQELQALKSAAYQHFARANMKSGGKVYSPETKTWDELDRHIDLAVPDDLNYSEETEWRQKEVASFLDKVFKKLEK